MSDRKWEVHFHETRKDVEENNQLDVVDLGDVWEGEVGEKTIYIQNGPLYAVKDIIYEANDSGVMVEGPGKLDAGEVAPLSIRWVPSVDSFGLKDDLVINATIIYRKPFYKR